VRTALRDNLVNPLNLLLISRDRIEEVVDEAVSRGRMTAGDAQDVVEKIVARGREQTNDVLNNLETLLGRGRSRLESVTDEARERGTSAASGARKRVERTVGEGRKRADAVRGQADRARRAVGAGGGGSSFPIRNYDNLTAAQIQDRLDSLDPPELRKVRDYERRNANRKTVLGAIESKLS